MSYDLSLDEVYFRLKEIRGDRKILLYHYFRLPKQEDWQSYYRGFGEVGLNK